MKFTFNRKEFLEAIAIGGSYAGSNRTLPVLEDVKITINDNKAWIMSYDDKNAIKTVCDVQSDVDFYVICINKNKISDYVALLDSETFDIEIEEKKSEIQGQRIISATILAGNGSIVIPCEDPKLFAELKNDKGTESVEIPADLLSYWINTGVQFLGELIDMKLAIGCLHFIVKDGKINVFACDNFKMYHDSYKIEDNNVCTEFSIPRNAFNGIVRALKKEDKVTIKNGANNIIFICDKSILLVRKLDFKIPNYAKLLTFGIKYEFSVNKKRLLNILQKASNIHDGKNKGIVSFQFEPDCIRISSENWEGNIKMNDLIDVGGGDGLSQNFTIPYIMATINGISGEEILLCVTGDRQPIYVKSPENESEITMNSPFIC